MPFALYEQLLNPTERNVLEMLRKASNQTHLHVLLAGPGQDLIGRYEFANTFQFDALLPSVETAVAGPALQFEAAKREYEQMYDLQTLFQLDTSEEHPNEREEDGAPNESEYKYPLDWKAIERAAKSAF